MIRSTILTVSTMTRETRRRRKEGKTSPEKRADLLVADRRTSERPSVNVQVNLSERATSQSNRGGAGDIAWRADGETADGWRHAPAASTFPWKYRGGVEAPTASSRALSPGRTTPGPRHWHTRRPCHTASSASTTCERQLPAGQEEDITSRVTSNYHGPRTTARTTSESLAAMPAIIVKNQYGFPFPLAHFPHLPHLPHPDWVIE